MDLLFSQSQTQVITPMMIQSVQMLQLNAMELKEYLEKASLDNPLMEIEDIDENDSNFYELDLQRKLDWLSATDHQNKIYYRSDLENDYISNIPDQNRMEESITGYLLSQLDLNRFSKRELCILKFLMESLDERGYISEDIDTLSYELTCSHEDVKKGLDTIKSLDPAGIGAKDLGECLLLQLNRLGRDSVLAKRIIKDHLEDLGKCHIHIISKKLNVSLEDVQEVCETIRSLNPKPASRFCCRKTLSYISPDVIVVKNAQAFTILTNEYTYPKIGINSYYESLLHTTNDEKTIKYIKEKLDNIKQLKESIELRKSTLSRCAHVIVERQLDFFLHGSGHKMPLKLSDISEELGLHESTISRALSGKYLQCMQGTFPLNYFLTQIATKSLCSGENITKDSVVEQIKCIIENEDKSHPLSDQAISKKLLMYDMKISRRTVNKYRTQLNIPDKSGRLVRA